MEVRIEALSEKLGFITEAEQRLLPRLYLKGSHCLNVLLKIHFK